MTMERRTKRIGCGFILIGLWTFAPILSVLIASAIASGFGCQLDEGSAHSCVVAGADIGELLYTLFVMGWFFFVTIPTGVVAAVIFLVIVLISARKRRSP